MARTSISRPRTDPNEIIKGMLLPFGSYEGSAIALMAWDLPLCALAGSPRTRRSTPLIRGRVGVFPAAVARPRPAARLHSIVLTESGVSFGVRSGSERKDQRIVDLSACNKFGFCRIHHDSDAVRHFATHSVETGSRASKHYARVDWPPGGVMRREFRRALGCNRGLGQKSSGAGALAAVWAPCATRGISIFGRARGNRRAAIADAKGSGIARSSWSEHRCQRASG